MKKDTKCIIRNGLDKLDTTLIEIVKNGRQSRRLRTPVNGLIEIETDCRGTNIRRIDTQSGGAMFSVFSPFSCPEGFRGERFKRPIYDEGNNGVVSADGWKMLVCRPPEGFTKDKAKEGGFNTGEVDFYPWSRVVGDMEHTPYVLSNYTKVGEVSKADKAHGLLECLGIIANAYTYDTVEEFRTIYVDIGGDKYNTVGVCELVDSLFKLGCDKVGFYRSWYGGYSPLHLFGFGTDFDAKGLIMPIRYYGEECAWFEYNFAQNTRAA